jgi:type III secretion protein L
MTLFTLIKKQQIHLKPKTKVIPAEEFSQLITASEVVAKTYEEEKAYRTEVAKECETLKELGEKAGFEEGLKQWNSLIGLLENEIKKVRQDMENAIVPLALTAVKKIIGREIELKPETIADIVATALKSVSHHRKITIYVNPNDLENIEAEKPRLKALFEHLESLSVASREDIDPGGCLIETELGIINAQLENQLLALEATFRHFYEQKKKKGKA